MESEYHTGGITITKDGVTVAKGLNLEDPVENLAVQLIRQAASQTATQAGDGTTTSVVLTSEIIESAGAFYKGEDNNLTEVLRHIQDIAAEMDKNLVKMSKKVTGKRLLDIATTSANNDRKLGKIIADAYSQVDHVTVDNSRTIHTYSDIVKGIKVDRGFATKFYVNDVKTNECILEKPYVLITNIEIDKMRQINSIAVPIIEKGGSLLIIAPLTINSASTLLKNVQEGNLKAASIIPPSMGYRQDELMTDLAIALGGRFISQQTGDNLESMTLEDLGRAEKIIVGKEKTIIIPTDYENESLAKHIVDLNESIKGKTSEEEISFVNERIANISGGVGVINIGANSDIEQKELKDRADDSVLAVRSAKEQGILPGGGIGLMSSIKGIEFNEDVNSDYNIALEIMCAAISGPFLKIIDNSGRQSLEILTKVEQNDSKTYGYDAKNGVYGDMLKLGIIDPTKVTRSALKNAVSVATTILSTGAVISNIRDYAGNK
jgi:chaperonin GroEL